MARRGGPALAAAAGAAIVAAVAQLGADLGWAAELGRLIVDRGSIPDGLPFAAAPSDGWPNVPVAGEVVLGLLWDGLGRRGPMLAQAAAAATAFGVVAADARAAGARGLQTAAALVLVGLGALSTLAVIRIQLFSLALFPCLVYLLRAEARSPSRRVWLLVPLIALWSNLHGGVLVGVLVAATYLVAERARTERATAAAVLVLLVAAVCATPALHRTVAYYAGVLGNEAAARGAGLWARPSLHSALDVVLLISSAALVALAVRARPRLWELLCLLGLSVATLAAARNGLWLVLFAAPRAATAVPLRFAGRRAGRLMAAAAAACAATAFAYGVARGPTDAGASDRLVTDAVRLAGGSPVLATPAIAEQIILAGGRVWIANPLDAFRHTDQERYLDWLDGPGAVPAGVSVVAAQAGSPPALRLAQDGRFAAASRDGSGIVFVRRR
jgi:hypothetical protein